MQITKEVIQKFDSIIARGLSRGLGNREGTMCIEAAMCAALDLPHGDDPGCVATAVRRFKIALNDKQWSSEAARAAGLRDLGVAQLGSKGVVSDSEFLRLLAEGITKQVIPELFRAVFTKDRDDHRACLVAAEVCEKEGTRESARGARAAAAYAAAAYAAADAAAYAAAAYAAADAAAAAYAAYAAADAAAAAAAAARQSGKTTDPDYYLKLVAVIALNVLRELKSPGVELALGADAKCR